MLVRDSPMICSRARSSIGYGDIRRARRVSSRVNRFVASDVARRQTKEPQAHYALGASLGDWAAGVSGGQGNRPASPNARIAALFDVS
jgi:hypothetical protein